MILALALLLGCPQPDKCADEPGTVCAWAGTGDAAYDGGGNHRLASMFYWPMDLTFSPYGPPVIADWNNHKLRLLEDDGTLTTIMGTAFVGDGPPEAADMVEPGAPGTTVALNHPTEQAWMPDGTLISASWHTHKLRSWDPATGLTLVVAGSAPGYVDGVPGAEARMNQPKAIIADEAGNAWFIDMRNERVRVLGADGVVRTVAGNGDKAFDGDGGPALEACFAFPKSENPEPGGALALSPDERTLYIADTENHRIRVVDLDTGLIDTLAGAGEPGFSGDGGPALQATFDHPRDIALHEGVLYVADTENHRVRGIDLATGLVDTVAGSGALGSEGDDGPALDASFNRPFGIAIDEAGDLYVADTFNHRIRRVIR